MKPEDLKNSINSIEPDSCMQTRLFAEISSKEKSKNKSKKGFKVAISAVLCCAILIVGLGFGIPKMAIIDSNNNVVASDVDYAGNYFVMSVYAAENEKETAIPIDDHTVIFPYLKYEIKRYGDGGLSMGISGKEDSEDSAAFKISGESIKSVKIKCETGTFNIWNFDMLHYLIDNGMYYDIIVPYSDEYEIGGTDKRLDIMFKHIKNGDYDEYIKDKEIKSYEEYISADVVYDKDDNVIGVGLVSKENYSKLHTSGRIQEYTFENVLNKTENIIGDNMFFWEPDFTEFLDNTDMSITELHDRITVEVTFNDNSVQYANYDFSFNDNGELVIDRIVAD
ncbi:MAG: hypothetical protein K2N83_03280 [Eubacterium sp.]|nr:hypothetical protein [Eubacterium sp.]